VEDNAYFKSHLLAPFKEQSWKVMKTKIVFTTNCKYGATFPDDIDGGEEKAWKAPGKIRPRYLYKHQREALFSMGYGYYGGHLPGKHESDHKMEMYDETDVVIEEKVEEVESWLYTDLFVGKGFGGLRRAALTRDFT